MPVQTTKSKLNFGKVAKAAAEKPIDWGREFVDLPGGITGGVARLASMKIGVYKSGPNQGNKFFHAAGTVEQPKSATKLVKIWSPKLNNGKGGVEVISSKEVDIEGQFTSIMIPLCDTKRKDKDGAEIITGAEEHLDEVYNEMKKLGGEECVSGVDSEADLEAVFAMLVDAKPAFKFSTQDKDPTKDYPNGGVWGHKWFGTRGLDTYQSDNSSAVEDSTPSSNGKAHAKASAPVDDAPDDDDNPPDDTPANNVDLQALAKLADKKGPKSAEAGEMETLAKQAGVDEQAMADADDWVAVAVLIESVSQEGKEDATADDAPADDGETPFVPKKGGIYYYYATDPKTKKEAKKGIEVDVESVDKKKGTCDVKSLDDKKIYKGVPWSAIRGS